MQLVLPALATGATLGEILSQFRNELKKFVFVNGLTLVRSTSIMTTTLTFTLTLVLTQNQDRSPNFIFIITHPLTHSLTHSLHSRTHALSLSLSLSHNHSLIRLADISYSGT